jgi:hypothetical protein
VAAESTKADVAPDEWEDVSTGLGSEHDFEKAGPLVAIYAGEQDVDLKEAREDGKTTAKAFIFADPETGEQLFVWDSYELREALAQVRTGQKVRISFLGREQFTGSKGPQQVKRYKVQRAKSA